MKTFFFLGILLFLSHVSQAQGAKPAGFDAQQNLNSISKPYTPADNMVRTFDDRYLGFKGDPYFINQWLPTEVLNNEGVKYQPSLIKLDIYEAQEVLMKRTTGDSIILDYNKIRQISISDTVKKKIYVFRRIAEPRRQETKADFYQVLLEGKYSLFVKRGKYVLKADFKGAYSNGIFYDEYKPTNIFYVKNATNDALEEVKNSKKAFLKALPNQEELLKTYIKTEKIDFDKEEDLIKLIRYYNSLL
ncbi:MAG: hypothetical protein EAZ97_13345 [Bacteroidetes bacterium]|nr:MAG: hypothetical protein EAZ97_13345 [Bacteroidota bacterium]